MLHTNDNGILATAFRPFSFPPSAFGWTSPALATALRDMRSVLARQLRRDELVSPGVATEHVAEIVILSHVMAIARERDPDDVPDLLQAALAEERSYADTIDNADQADLG